MRNRSIFWALLLVPLLPIAGLTGALAWWLPAHIDDPRLQAQALLAVLAGGFGLAVALVLVWVLLDRACWQPLRGLARGARIIARSNPGYQLELPGHHLLGNFPALLRELGEVLRQAREDVAAAVAAGSREAEQQKSRLETVLREISEGVVVCDADGRILLYNAAAASLLPNRDSLGLGRSLFGLWARGPIESTLSLLRYRETTGHGGAGNTSAFICATTDNRAMLRCRMSLLPPTADLPSAFVVVFRDITDQMRQLNLKLPLLKTSLQELCRPLANLRAAAENLTHFAGMDVEQRDTFQRLIVTESAILSHRLQAMAFEMRALAVSQWPMNDVYSSDLIGSLVHRLEQSGGPQVAPMGDPLWLHVDTHAILLLLRHLLRRLQACTGQPRFECECLLGNRRVYLDIVWAGRPVPVSEIERLTLEPVPDMDDNTTVGEVLSRHNSELWSQPHRRPGHALLRLPLPASRRQAPILDPTSERPEFYDFDLGHDAPGDLADQPLTSLHYVVFDTETTGLEPSRGDEIVQIAGVRVVNRRVLAGETFNRLVNPGRHIPAAAVRIHGIDDERVAHQPGIRPVLAEFKAFVGGDGAILVAHDAAFDMKLLQLKENGTGIRFRNPVLDTLLLSCFLHDHTERHTLKAIADRLDVPVQDRHTALGDALTTARVFIKLMDLLEAQGVVTLGQALNAASSLARMRKAQAYY